MATPTILLTKVHVGSKYVLTQGRAGRILNKGDYAVYFGGEHMEDHEVASMGSKLDWEAASKLFPNHIKSFEDYRK